MTPEARPTPDFRPEAESIDDKIAFWISLRIPGILAAVALGCGLVALSAHAIRLADLLARPRTLVEIIQSGFPHFCLGLFALGFLLICLVAAKGRRKPSDRAKSPARPLETPGPLWDRDMDGGS